MADNPTKKRGLVIGCGSMGSRRAAVMHAAGWSVDTMDQDPERAARCGTPITSTAPSLLPAPYDAAVIATPPDVHVGPARELIRQGVAKAILIEKPLALSLDLTETLVAEAAAAGIITMMGQSLRWHADLMTLRSSIWGDVLGPVLHVRAHFGHRLDLWAHPNPVATYTNGALLDAATHELDLVLWLANADATWLLADIWRTGLYDMPAEDMVDILMELESGAHASVHVDLADTTYRRNLTIVGGDRTADWHWRPDPAMYERETLAFLAAASGAERPPDWPDWSVGRRILELVIAARVSQGRAMDI